MTNTSCQSGVKMASIETNALFLSKVKLLRNMFKIKCNNIIAIDIIKAAGR